MRCEVLGREPRSSRGGIAESERRWRADHCVTRAHQECCLAPFLSRSRTQIAAKAVARSPGWAGGSRSATTRTAQVLLPYGEPMSARRWVVSLERAWDAARLRRAGSRPPADFRIEPYVGHGGGEGVVVRGRVVDDPAPAEALEGERVGAVVRRMVRHFVTDELPGVPLRIAVADASVETVTDAEGYFVARLRPDADELDEPVDGRHRRARWRVPRADRPARRDTRGAGSRRGCALRHHLRRRRHDPRDRRPAGRAHDPPDAHGVRPHPVVVPGSTGAVPRPRRRGESGLLRLVEPVEPACLRGGVPAAPGFSDGAGAAARPARHPRRPRAEGRPHPGGPRPAPPAAVRPDRRLR